MARTGFKSPLKTAATENLASSLRSERTSSKEKGQVAKRSRVLKSNGKRRKSQRGVQRSKNPSRLAVHVGRRKISIGITDSRGPEGEALLQRSEEKQAKKLRKEGSP